MRPNHPGDWVDTAKGLADFSFDEYPMQVTTRPLHVS